MNEIRCKGITFFSRGDEEAFFLWARTIPHIREIGGERDEIVLRLQANAIADDSLRELIGLFHRYGVAMRQLAAFETVENKAWFRDTEKYWHAAVFGNRSPQV
jgi:hypothetical protein